MSSTNVRAALETALAAVSPALATAWENKSFTPAVGTPYQRVTVLFAEPDNVEIGRTFLERGFMQVDLRFPVGTGPGAAQTQAEVLRAAFWRGRTLVASGQNVLIDKTPAILAGFEDEDRYVVPVRIRFRS